MSAIGPNSGIDLIRWMQSGGDLALQYVMFDREKCIDNWTTLRAHVHDFLYCKMMTICICDMKLEMAEHQK